MRHVYIRGFWFALIVCFSIMVSAYLIGCFLAWGIISISWFFVRLAVVIALFVSLYGGFVAMVHETNKSVLTGIRP